MPRYQITVPGYEYNDNGADYHPDAFEEFEGTKKELLAYLLKMETRYQMVRAVQTMNPARAWVRRLCAQEGLMTDEEWEKIPRMEKAPCTEWVRGVVEIRDVAGIDVLAVAISEGKKRADKLIQEAKDAVAEDERVAVLAREDAERVEFERLSKKFKDRT